MWPEEKVKKERIIESRYREGDMWYETAWGNLYIRKDRMEELYKESLKEELDKKIENFYREFAAEEEYGMKNYQITPKSNGDADLIARDKHQNIIKITYNTKEKTVGGTPFIHNGQVTIRMFTREELKFFDMLGFNLTEDHTQITNQVVEDWWSM